MKNEKTATVLTATSTMDEISSSSASSATTSSSACSAGERVAWGIGASLRARTDHGGPITETVETQARWESRAV